VLYQQLACIAEPKEVSRHMYTPSQCIVHMRLDLCQAGPMTIHFFGKTPSNNTAGCRSSPHLSHSWQEGWEYVLEQRPHILCCLECCDALVTRPARGQWCHVCEANRCLRQILQALWEHDRVVHCTQKHCSLAHYCNSCDGACCKS
jgi:hypothetical protein